jgi:hypothetical protein
MLNGFLHAIVNLMSARQSACGHAIGNLQSPFAIPE